MVHFLEQMTAARRIPVLPLLRQGVFLGRKETGTMMYAIESMSRFSLNSAFANGTGIAVSISDLFVFRSKLL